jgi:hypothetical protein
MSLRENNLEKYEAAVALHSEIERKGKANPSTSHNGHMFSFLDKEGVLGIRLSKENREAFEEEYKTGPFIQYNAVMNGYVTIPQEVLDNAELTKHYLNLGLEFVSSLKPK